MPDRPWYPRYPADYIVDTLDLSLEEDGLYTRLLDAYWNRGGLPDDEAALARISRVSRRKLRAHSALIQRFFTRENGRLINRRMEEELRKTSSISDKRRAAAESRWSKTGDASASVRARGSQPQPHKDSPPTGSPPSKPERAKPRKRISRDWRPGANIRKWAAKQGIRESEVDAHVDEFVQYWIDDGSPKASWDATYMNRLRKVARYENGSRPINGGGRFHTPRQQVEHHQRERDAARAGAGRIIEGELDFGAHGSALVPDD